jgi:transposase InsO family protein
MREVLIAPRSPWQNPYVERLIGLTRRECLNPVIVFNERHLKKRLRAYFVYYHKAKTHLALDKQCPEPRAVESLGPGAVIALPHIGGLHHEYRRAARDTVTKPHIPCPTTDCKLLAHRTSD